MASSSASSRPGLLWIGSCVKMEPGFGHSLPCFFKTILQPPVHSLLASVGPMKSDNGPMTDCVAPEKVDLFVQ